MSKRGRRVRSWHYRRIQDDFDEEPETIIREMFEEEIPLTVMAGALDISYGEMHEWIKELDLSRPPIAPTNRHPTRERLWDEWNFDPVRLICADRKMGMSYHEIRKKYGVSAGFVANCLREGAPWLIGDRDIPAIVRLPMLSDTERQRRSEQCREHNRQMKERQHGWFADMHRCYCSRKIRES